MNVVFLNAALAGFLALALVPLLVHLFARSHPPEYRFSSNEFIQRIVRQSMRVRKPREWLLLFLRTLAFVALILVFLRPFAFPEKPVGGLFQKRNVVFIVDATASMACVEGAQTRFGAACAEVSHGLAGLSSSDTANIIWIRSTPSPVFPELSSNLRYLQDAARRAGVSSETGSVQPALKLALEMLEKSEGRREIRVISDFQQSTWAGIEMAVPKSVELGKIKVAHEEAANTSIVRLRCEPASPVTGEDVTVFCDVRNDSPQRRHCSVYFNAGDMRQSQEIMLGEWGSATAVCKLKAARPGPLPVSATLDEDAFPADDKRWTILPVRESLRVGIYEGAQSPDKQLASTWRKALECLGWAHVEKVTDLRGDLPVDVLMLAGWDGAEAPAVQSRIAAGTTVVCFPAPTDFAVVTMIALTGAHVEPGYAVRWEESPEHTLRIQNTKADVFRIFMQGDFGDPSRGHFRARLNTAHLPDVDSLLDYDDGVPALARLGKKGTFYLWNLAVDAQWSDWAAQTEFVPFMGELLLTSRVQNQAVEGIFEPGESVLARIDHDALPSEISLSDEAGQVLPIVAKTGQSRTFASRDPLKPGLYTWKFRQTPVAFSAVNFPTVESDLRTLPEAEINRGNVLAALGSRLIKDSRDAMPLWPWLLGLGVVLIVAEGGVLLWKE